MTAGHGGARYCILIAGHLDPSWASWFGELAFRHRDDGTTTLEGPVVDQAALYGLLERARDLGLTLLAVERLPRPSRDEAGSWQRVRSVAELEEASMAAATSPTERSGRRAAAGPHG